MADNLVITLDALEPRATDMAQHLQASLDAATSLKAFTAEASKRAGETARLIGDHTLSVGKLFTGFDGLVEAQRDRLTARLGQASTQLVELKGMSLQHARELEQEHRDNETITRDLLDRLESFRQSLKSAGEAQRTVFAAGVLAVQVAQKGVFQAHAAVRAEFTSLSEEVTTAGRNLGTTLSAHSQGLQAASTACSRMTGDFATQTAGAGTHLDTRVQEVQDKQVRPMMALRAVQYTGSLSKLQTGTTDAVDTVHTAVENHDSVGSAQADLLASGYENHKRHVLSTLPTTDQELADKVGFVKEVADYITKENPPPVEDTRNWFQKTWDWISHGVGEAASAVGNVVGTAWTNTSHWVVEHGNEILIGVGVVAVAAGAIILICGTGGLATPAVVAGAAGSSAAIAAPVAVPMVGSFAGSAGAAAAGLHIGGTLVATEGAAVAATIGVALAPEAATAAVIAPALFSVGGFAVDATVGGVSLAGVGGLITAAGAIHPPEGPKPTGVVPPPPGEKGPDGTPMVRQQADGTYIGQDGRTYVRQLDGRLLADGDFQVASAAPGYFAPDQISLSQQYYNYYESLFGDDLSKAVIAAKNHAFYVSNKLGALTAGARNQALAAMLAEIEPVAEFGEQAADLSIKNRQAIAQAIGSCGIGNLIGLYKLRGWAAVVSAIGEAVVVGGGAAATEAEIAACVVVIVAPK